MNLRRILIRRGFIVALLILHVITFILFPGDSFASTSQEWWLPVMLLVMVVIADIELIVRRSDKTWPWYLIGFANGFNIISRLMMVWSHATITADGTSVINASYILLTILSIALSAFMLVYTEWPEVRMGLLRALAPAGAGTR